MAFYTPSFFTNTGFIQLVDQTDTLAHVLQSFKNIQVGTFPRSLHARNISHKLSVCVLQNFFRHFGPMEGAPYGIDPDVMDTYVKSCGETCQSVLVSLSTYVVR